MPSVIVNIIFWILIAFIFCGGFFALVVTNKLKKLQQWFEKLKTEEDADDDE